MSSYVSGNQIRTLWTVLDQNSSPLTGVTTPAGITFTLHRDSGSAYVAASETVSWAEIGVTGHYYISFTPANTGRYTLQLKELHVSSLGRTWVFHYDVLAAGAVFVPAYSNAFCSESDVERWLQQDITSSTKPSDTQVAGFAETRASILMSLCARLGYSVTPSTVTSGSRIEDLLRDANAIGAGWDATVSQTFGTAPSKTERAGWLEGLWVGYVGDGDKKAGILEMEIRGNLASLSTDHILSGDTTAATETTPTDAGIQVGMDSLY